jgi:hypothetical protein
MGKRMKKFGKDSTKFDGLAGLDYNNRQLCLAAGFQAFLSPPKKEGWFWGEISYHVDGNGKIDRIYDMKITCVLREEGK